MTKNAKVSTKRLESLKKARIESIKSRKSLAREHKLKKSQTIIQKILSNLKNDTSHYCSHYTIGSSLFLKLIDGELTPKDTHMKGNSIGAHSRGNSWENYVQNQNHFKTEKNEWYWYKVTEKDPFLRSEICPILVATPDFAIQFKTSFLKMRPGLLEVKSHNRAENKDAFCSNRRNKQILQLQVALQAAKINTGFLYLVKANSENSESAEYVSSNVVEVSRDLHFFRRYRRRILIGFAKYLARCSSFPDEPTEDLLEFSKMAVFSQSNNIIRQDFEQQPKESLQKIGQIPKIRRSCQISSLIAKQLNNQRNRKAWRGRPRLSEKSLKRSRNGPFELVSPDLTNLCIK